MRLVTHVWKYTNIHYNTMLSMSAAYQLNLYYMYG